MTKITLYIKNKSTAQMLERLCDMLPGIYMLEHDEYDDKGNKTEKSYAKILGDKRLVKSKTALDEAMEDVRNGRVERLNSVSDLLMLIEE